MLKPLIATTMLVGALVALSGTALAGPTDTIHVPQPYEVQTGPDNPCNGVYDNDCKCPGGVNFCNSGETCRFYAALTCVRG